MYKIYTYEISRITSFILQLGRQKDVKLLKLIFRPLSREPFPIKEQNINFNEFTSFRYLFPK